MDSSACLKFASAPWQVEIDKNEQLQIYRSPIISCENSHVHVEFRLLIDQQRKVKKEEGTEKVMSEFQLRYVSGLGKQVQLKSVHLFVQMEGGKESVVEKKDIVMPKFMEGDGKKAAVVGVFPAMTVKDLMAAKGCSSICTVTDLCS